jgi:hypothetical protein
MAAVDYPGSFLGNGLNSPGVILNLSTAGCRGSSKGSIREDALLRVLIDDASKRTERKSHVRHLQRNGDPVETCVVSRNRDLSGAFGQLPFAFKLSDVVE